jgi:hypothetical protein
MSSDTEVSTRRDVSNDSALIVVLGMHRSGTSALTRAMSALGADFGTNLMPAAEGVNDKGFFEDLDINAINIAVMQAAGADWDTMAPIDINTIEPQHLDRLQTDAIALLRAKCHGKIFALKDPRIARLLPFWQPIFARIETRIKYLIAFRNPISVAKSLSHRNHFPEEKSHHLWLAHTVPALQMTHAATRALIDYDRLMDSPRRELTRVATELGLPLVETALVEFEREFLDNDLRHSRFLPADLELVRSAPRQAKALFRALSRVVSETDHDARELDTITDEARRYLEDVAPLLANEWRLELEIRQLRADLAERDIQIHQLNQRPVRAKHEDGFNPIRSREPSEEASTMSRSDGDADGHFDNLHDENRVLRRSVDSLKAALSAQQAQLTRASDEMAAILASTSWRISAPLRALKRRMARRR